MKISPDFTLSTREAAAGAFRRTRLELSVAASIGDLEDFQAAPVRIATDFVAGFHLAGAIAVTLFVDMGKGITGAAINGTIARPKDGDP